MADGASRKRTAAAARWAAFANEDDNEAGRPRTATPLPPRAPACPRVRPLQTGHLRPAPPPPRPARPLPPPPAAISRPPASAPRALPPATPAVRVPDEPHTIYFDGGSRGNGSASAVAGIGAAIFSAAGEKIFTVSASLPRGTTNNAAEYRALIAALRLFAHVGGRRATVVGDSNLVVQQMRGAFRVKKDDLVPLHTVATVIASGFAEVSVSYVPREHNAVADALANYAMDSRNARFLEVRGHGAYAGVDFSGFSPL